MQPRRLTCVVGDLATVGDREAVEDRRPGSPGWGLLADTDAQSLQLKAKAQQEQSENTGFMSEVRDGGGCTVTGIENEGTSGQQTSSQRTEGEG